MFRVQTGGSFIRDSKSAQTAKKFRCLRPVRLGTYLTHYYLGVLSRGFSASNDPLISGTPLVCQTIVTTVMIPFLTARSPKRIIANRPLPCARFRVGFRRFSVSNDPLLSGARLDCQTIVSVVICYSSGPSERGYATTDRPLCHCCFG